MVEGVSVSRPRKPVRLEVRSLEALLRIWSRGGSVLHTSVMKPALKPPKGRIHQKHCREDVTVTLVVGRWAGRGGKRGTRRKIKKEKQKVDFMLIPEIWKIWGLPDPGNYCYIKSCMLASNGPGKNAVCCP